MRTASALIFLFLAISVSAQTPADFTGHWRERADSRSDRRLEVEQNGNKLRVKTVVTNSKGTRTLEVTYEIGGPETVYKGLDGDEFHSSARWDGKSLVFEIIEHERGSEIPQHTVWTLSNDRNSLLVDRRSTKSAETTHSSTTYVRQP